MPINFAIKTIIAKNNLPLSQKDIEINPTRPIWNCEYRQERNLRGSLSPAAFKITGTAAQITVSADLSSTSFPIWIGIKMLHLREIKFQTQQDKWIANAGVESFDLFSFNIPVKFNWLVEELSLVIELKDMNGKIETSHIGGIFLELYWIYDHDNLLFRKGVPIEILRIASIALEVMENIKLNITYPNDTKTDSIIPSQDPVVPALVYACFFRNPPVYDIKTYSSFFLGSDLPDETIFLLYNYLNATHYTDSICNCNDLATALQVFLKAIGIKNVYSCRSDFGFLKMTQLVGKGVCNSPSDIIGQNNDYENDFVMNEKDIRRKKFDSHSFCCISDPHGLNFPFPSSWIKCQGDRCKNCRILDACVGPHFGNECFEEYFDNTLDKIIPLPFIFAHPSNIDICRGVTHINHFPIRKIETQFTHFNAFKNAIKLELNVYSNQESFFLYSGLIIENSCLMDIYWEKKYENIIPGVNQAQKTWIMKKNGRSIQIDLFVSSPSQIHPNITSIEMTYQTALYHFLVLGSMSTMANSPYLKGPEYLGKYSAVFESENYNRYLWMDNNVVFDIRMLNNPPDFNVHAWLQKLNELLVTKAKDKIDYFVKSWDNISDRTIRRDQGNNEFIISYPSEDDKVFVDFYFNSGKGIQLLKQEQKKLTFRAIEPSENKISITFVDKETLLSSSKEITIIVE